MDKFEKVFAHEKYGQKAEFELAATLRDLYAQNPNVSDAVILHHAERIAKEWGGIEEGIKTQYVGGKAVVAKTIPAGAGKPGSAIPGKGPTKLSFDGSGPNTTAKALERRLRAGMEAEAS